MNNPFETHGAFSWTELMTHDLAAARDYYGQLLGWQFREMSPGGHPYAVITAGGQDIGGMMTLPEEIRDKAPPHWGSYVTVDDVDALAARAAELGGRIIVPPTDIPTVGRFCVIMDPQRAKLSFITYRLPQS